MRILFADDDPDLCRAVKVLLEHEGYDVEIADNGADALDLAQSGEYDVMILDWMMPEMSGLAVLKELRKNGVHTPCLMLTARSEVEDRVAGLDSGADDYLSKPFNTKELLARLRAIIRRHEVYAPDVIRFGDLELDRGSMDLRCGGESIRLGNKAYRLMEMLMENPHRVFTIDQVINRVWGWNNDTELNLLWVTVSQLRKKLASLGSSAEITAVRGVGYSLEKGKTADDAEAST
ncbi:MAG: response regulator transcription factor [Clostridia bacterium]|nr:response regulator transcription factor [Clostridia bacterium]